MGKMSRTKGATAERELSNLLFDHLGIEIHRNLEQSRSGGHDLAVVEPGSSPVAAAIDLYAIEIKRYSKVSPGLIAQWWTQATEQAVRADKIPCLAYRADRAEWRVVIPLYAISGELSRADCYDSAATLSLSGFCGLIRES